MLTFILIAIAALLPILILGWLVKDTARMAKNSPSEIKRVQHAWRDMVRNIRNVGRAAKGKDLL